VSFVHHIQHQVAVNTLVKGELLVQQDLLKRPCVGETLLAVEVEGLHPVVLFALVLVLRWREEDLGLKCLPGTCLQEGVIDPLHNNRVAPPVKL
jgi:hypothetical protein